MVSSQAKLLKRGSVQRRTLLQLLLSHSLILVVVLLLRHWSWSLSLLIGCLVSFLFTLSIPYNLHLLESALQRLERGLAIEPIWSPIRWPLTSLFVLVDSLGQQTGKQVQREQRNVEYRDQLVQQVGKTAAQEERNRLARDLHDSIKQQIFSIVVSAAAVKARWERNPASALKVVDDIEQTAQEAQVEMQALLQELRPVALENVGLIESLRMQCQALGYRTGAEVTAELGELPSDEVLPIGSQEMIFRIVQEGFANIARHARASHVWLSLRQQRDALLVEIGDDGQGFDLSQANELPNSYGGMGLCNVRERVRDLGGTVAVWSLPTRGTTLHLCIPLVRARPEEQEQALKKQELAKTVHKARRTLRIGTWTAELAAALILVYIPTAITGWLLLPAIIITLACLLLAQQQRFQIALEFGREHPQNLALLARSYTLLAGTLLLSLVTMNYFKLYLLIKGPSFTVGIISFFLLAILVAYLFFSRTIDRYYRSISLEALQGQLREQLQQLVVDWAVWVIVTGLIIFQWSVLPGSVAMGLLTDGIQQICSIFISIAWLISIVLKTIRIIHWYDELYLLKEQVSKRRKGR